MSTNLDRGACGLMVADTSMTAEPQPQPDEVLDPVCGMTISPDDAVGTAAHRGQTYYFCAESCLEQFKADPERFLDPKRREADAAGLPQDVEYTCPMHPEVRQIGPGACPKCGMALEPTVDTGAEIRNPELDDMLRRLKVSAALVAPIAAVMLADMIPGQPLMHAFGDRTIAWAQMILATPIVLWGGAPFFARGWASIVNRYPNMFTLIALGVGAAYGFSVVATLAPGMFPPSFREDGHVGVYFEAAAVIVVLVLLGQVLELRARSRTSSAIRALLNLTPHIAHRLADGVETDVELAQVGRRGSAPRPSRRARAGRRHGRGRLDDGRRIDGHGRTDPGRKTCRDARSPAGPSTEPVRS